MILLGGKLMEEKWKEVIGYNGRYLISNKGNLYSNFSKRNLVGNSTRGYKYYVLTKNNKSECLKAHRLVAIAFIPNTKNKPCVNHIDGNPSNNNVNNLEWVTHSENTKHAFKIGLQKPLVGKCNPMFNKRGKENAKSKPIEMLSKKDNLCIKEFESIELAVSFLKENGHKKANSSSISQCCNKKRYKSAYGYVWRFKNDENV